MTQSEPADLNDRSKYQDVVGSRLYYVASGNADPNVFLHGTAPPVLTGGAT
jgi:hypothetical protein